MSELDVRIVTLPPMRVAAALGFGPEPEMLAWDALLNWARPLGLLDQPHRFFGFNNPSPAPGSPNYGYEQWLTIGPDVTAAEGITIKEFAGGLYAVTRCTLIDIVQKWQEFMAWRARSRYHGAHHQWLEEALFPGEIDFDANRMQLDLYMPIAE